MVNNNKQFDTNSEPRKTDVLRARDIIPSASPYRNIADKEENSQETIPNAPYPPAVKNTPVETDQKTSEIPKFNLAEKIMAEHRKITAIRRKAPGEKDGDQKQEREAEPAKDTAGQLKSPLSEQRQIIAEIVARDIEMLCRGSARIGRKQEF
ncbi:MAG: hypothetical protein GWN67_11310 [Phycisphaerae bacterium]|nr:hypothetical protein [Phycisphaerae bacterium]NIP54997.1 hypothetical protein [Phycisphaerae bacterium]NIS53712.1 hypothetical protein [Phycisphaerae bacterium]NIU11283.1 hypothetical protein [Phycisphaerae bacterium]NIU56940.1 hypothetical protein [Phycisphaerae bacterium]